MTMEISKQKMCDIRQEINTWLYRKTAKCKEVESLIGKLQFIEKCIKVGRVFLSRLIQWIRHMNRSTEYPIPQEARKDIAWWGRCAANYNRVSIIWLHKDPMVDNLLATDACLTGYGGTRHNEYFRARFPKEYKGLNLAYLEILAVMVTLKVWGSQLAGKYFWVHMDRQLPLSAIQVPAGILSYRMYSGKLLCLQQLTSLS